MDVEYGFELNDLLGSESDAFRLNTNFGNNFDDLRMHRSGQERSFWKFRAGRKKVCFRTLEFKRRNVVCNNWALGEKVLSLKIRCLMGHYCSQKLELK